MGAKWPTDDQALITDSGGKEVNDLRHQKRYFIQILLATFQYFEKIVENERNQRSFTHYNESTQ